PIPLPDQARLRPFCISRQLGEFFRASQHREQPWTHRFPLLSPSREGTRSFPDPYERSWSCSWLCPQFPSRVLHDRIPVPPVPCKLRELFKSFGFLQQPPFPTSKKNAHRTPECY